MVQLLFEQHLFKHISKNPRWRGHIIKQLFANKFILYLQLILLLLVQQNNIHNVLGAFLPILSIHFIIVPCFELLHVYTFHAKFIQQKPSSNHVEFTSRFTLNHSWRVRLIFMKVESSDAIWYINQMLCP